MVGCGVCAPSILEWLLCACSSVHFYVLLFHPRGWGVVYSFNVGCGLSHCSCSSSCPVIEGDCLRLFLVLDYPILGGWLEIFI